MLFNIIYVLYKLYCICPPLSTYFYLAIDQNNAFYLNIIFLSQHKRTTVKTVISFFQKLLHSWRKSDDRINNELNAALPTASFSHTVDATQQCSLFFEKVCFRERSKLHGSIEFRLLFESTCETLRLFLFY